MEKTVSQRIMDYLKFKRISVNALCKETGLKQSTIHGQLAGPVMLSMDTVMAIVVAFPELSAEWLLRGTGSMELEESGLPDPELKEICIEQTREIYRLRQRLDEYEQPKKGHA